MTIISGFLVYVGFMDFIPTYLTVIAGDLTGDMIYYSAGRWWLNGAYKGLLKFFKIKREVVLKLENGIKKQKGPFLFFGKISHAIGGLILFAAGSAKISIREFLEFNFLATLPKSLILIAVGYYFGNTVDSFNKALDYTVVGLFILTIVLIGLYFGVTRLSHRFIDKFEK